MGEPDTRSGTDDTFPVLAPGSDRINRKDFVLFFCVGLFMVSLVLAAITAVKIHEVHLGPVSILVPAGTLAFGLTYLATDVISEVWGRAYALSVVFVGLIMRFVMLLLILYALHIEEMVGFISNADSWSQGREDAFTSVLASSNRINIAGMVAFGLSALSDVMIFHWLREAEQGKNRLWLRNNVSTMASQVFNSLVFVTVAFAGVLSWAAIGSLIVGQVLMKILVASVDTPLVYLLRNIATGRRLLDFTG